MMVSLLGGQPPWYSLLENLLEVCYSKVLNNEALHLVHDSEEETARRKFGLKAV